VLASSLSRFLQARCPVCCSTNSQKALKETHQPWKVIYWHHPISILCWTPKQRNTAPYATHPVSGVTALHYNAIKINTFKETVLFRKTVNASTNPIYKAAASVFRISQKCAGPMSMKHFTAHRGHR